MGKTDEEILKRLDQLTKLKAIQLSAGKNKSESIPLLAKAGFSAIDIAELLDTTPNTVHVALHHSRKKSKSKKELKDAGSTQNEEQL